MEPPTEPSRSFKRRQRRKKQLERRRQANDGPAGSSDEHEPSGAAAGEPHPGADWARPAAAAVTEAERSQPGPTGSCVPSPAVRAASAGSALRPGKGRPRRSSRPEREEGRADEVPPGSAAQEGTESGPSEPAGPQHTPPAEEKQPNGAETAGRPKSGSAKRRKRKSTGPSGAVPESQPAEPDPSPGQPAGRAPSLGQPAGPDPSLGQPAGPDPSLGQPAEPDPSPGQPAGPDPSPSPAAVERVSPAAEPEPARRRETSPVVSSSEEVLRSIRTPQTVLEELRTGLLAAPPPATAPKAPTQVPGAAPAAGRSPTQAAPAPSPAAVAAAAAAAAVAVIMPPPTDAEPATEGEAPQKTKEQVKAERRAKAEAAKLAKAAKASQKKQATAAAAADGASVDNAPVKAGQEDGAAGQASGKPAGKAPERAAPAQPTEKPATDDAARPAAGKAPEKPAGEKSKAELKAERRAKQEAQRAAKAAAAAATPSAKSGAATAASKAAAPAKSGKGAAEARQATPVAGRNQETESRSDRRSAKKTTEKTATKKGLQMFSHLPQFDASSTNDLIVQHRVHPTLVPLLLRLSAGRLSGANAGAVALLAALADLVDQYSTPAQRELRRDLPHLVRRAVDQVAQCRPLSVAMENVTHQLEQAIPARVPADMADHEAKEVVIKWIEDFIRDDICKAMSGIKGFAGEKIKDDDVILTYGRSTAVMEVLLSAHQSGRRFRVLVVDSRPRLDGRDTLRQLLDAGVPCSYGVITAISHHMKEATKVLLGAQALLSNGMVLSQAGTALVCLTGRAHNRPVLICCETYKFSDRVQIDSQVYNHLGDPDELVCSAESPLADWRRSESLSLLNLMYDVTPPELVDAVITELGAIPCSSVPAVLRLQQTVM